MRFQRDSAPEPRVVGEIDTPHPAPAKLPDDRVAANHVPRPERVGLKEQAGHARRNRRFEKRARTGMVIEQREHLRLHRTVRGFPFTHATASSSSSARSNRFLAATASAGVSGGVPVTWRRSPSPETATREPSPTGA